MKSRLSAGEKLVRGERLTAPNRRAIFNMQDDGNLVVYHLVDDNYEPKWATMSNGSAASHVVMQADGNCVLYDDAGRDYWNSQTFQPGSFIQIQDDGNLVVYNGAEQPLWASNTVMEVAHGPPGCGVYCRFAFPLYYDQMILAFKALRAAGVTEARARELAQDGGALAGELYAANFGLLAGIAAAFVASNCALCAVDSAY